MDGEENEDEKGEWEEELGMAIRREKEEGNKDENNFFFCILNVYLSVDFFFFSASVLFIFMCTEVTFLFWVLG